MRKVKLFLIGMLICGAVHAEEWMELKNQAGGKILLLAHKCGLKGAELGRMVIATSPAGPNTNGCWYVLADMIHIVWEGGGTSSFDPKDFDYRKSK
jgi:hypothetical protein